MNDTTTRRSLLGGGAAALGAWLLEAPAGGRALASSVTPGDGLPIDFPSQERDAVRAVVGASHGNFEAVREWVDARPELAKSSWDWGFGDWESALGAAAHTGNRDIALYLIEHGARPDLFAAAMLGQLDVVRSFVEASPGIQGLPGPHGIPLLAHARSGGRPAAEVFAYLEALGGADAGAADLPLDLGREPFVGLYVFADGPTGAFEVSIGQRGDLMLGRSPDGVERRLSHQGGYEFHPAGAPSARVRFQVVEGTVKALEIRNPALVVLARRLDAP